MTRGAREAWGRWAESLAAWSLRLRGYRVLARRFIDLFGLPEKVG